MCELLSSRAPAQGLSLSVPLKQGQQLTILNHVSGVFEPGSMTALVGSKPYSASVAQQDAISHMHNVLHLTRAN